MSEEEDFVDFMAPRDASILSRDQDDLSFDFSSICVEHLLDASSPGTNLPAPDVSVRNLCTDKLYVLRAGSALSEAAGFEGSFAENLWDALPEINIFTYCTADLQLTAVATFYFFFVLPLLPAVVIVFDAHPTGFLLVSCSAMALFTLIASESPR